MCYEMKCSRLFSASVGFTDFYFYARKQLLLSARLSHHNSVCLSVRLSVRHTSGSVKNGASWNYQIFTVGCPEDSSFRRRKAFS